jgi:DNA replication protein
MTRQAFFGSAEKDPSFKGFPAGARATTVPSLFFIELLPQIEDADELRVTLYAIYALGRRRGYPRFVSERELRAEAPLMATLSSGGDDTAGERLHAALERATDRGVLLSLSAGEGNERDTLYLLNTPSNRRALLSIKQGRLQLGRPLPPERGVPAPQRHNVFQLYEANIGPLTPLVAEELKEAEELYPYEWLEAALREAALLNKRSWRYASRILQRWATEGRRREEAGRDPQAGSARAQILRRYRGLGG